ncbi:unnamed protein product [Amoebophrya sp. A120]|nr:unnamed protein product [Amoebophrya sp. A120]|eukprot:GSA120T00025134001.1
MGKRSQHRGSGRRRGAAGGSNYSPDERRSPRREEDRVDHSTRKTISGKWSSSRRKRETTAGEMRDDMATRNSHDTPRDSPTGTSSHRHEYSTTATAGNTIDSSRGFGPVGQEKRKQPVEHQHKDPKRDEREPREDLVTDEQLRKNNEFTGKMRTTRVVGLNSDCSDEEGLEELPEYDLRRTRTELAIDGDSQYGSSSSSDEDEIHQHDARREEASSDGSSSSGDSSSEDDVPLQPSKLGRPDYVQTHAEGEEALYALGFRVMDPNRQTVGNKTRRDLFHPRTPKKFMQGYFKCWNGDSQEREEFVSEFLNEASVFVPASSTSSTEKNRGPAAMKSYWARIRKTQVLVYKKVNISLVDTLRRSAVVDFQVKWEAMDEGGKPAGRPTEAAFQAILYFDEYGKLRLMKEYFVFLRRGALKTADSDEQRKLEVEEEEKERQAALLAEKDDLQNHRVATDHEVEQNHLLSDSDISQASSDVAMDDVIYDADNSDGSKAKQRGQDADRHPKKPWKGLQLSPRKPVGKDKMVDSDEESADAPRGGAGENQDQRGKEQGTTHMEISAADNEAGRDEDVEMMNGEENPHEEEPYYDSDLYWSTDGSIGEQRRFEAMMKEEQLKGNTPQNHTSAQHREDGKHHGSSKKTNAKSDDPLPPTVISESWKLHEDVLGIGRRNENEGVKLGRTKKIKVPEFALDAKESFSPRKQFCTATFTEFLDDYEKCWNRIGCMHRDDPAAFGPTLHRAAQWYEHRVPHCDETGQQIQKDLIESGEKHEGSGEWESGRGSSPIQVSEDNIMGDNGDAGRQDQAVRQAADAPTFENGDSNAHGDAFAFKWFSKGKVVAKLCWESGGIMKEYYGPEEIAGDFWAMWTNERGQQLLSFRYDQNAIVVDTRRRRAYAEVAVEYANPDKVRKFGTIRLQTQWEQRHCGCQIVCMREKFSELGSGDSNSRASTFFRNNTHANKKAAHFKKKNNKKNSKTEKNQKQENWKSQNKKPQLQKNELRKDATIPKKKKWGKTYPAWAGPKVTPVAAKIGAGAKNQDVSNAKTGLKTTVDDEVATPKKPFDADITASIEEMAEKGPDETGEEHQRRVEKLALEMMRGEK